MPDLSDNYRRSQGGGKEAMPPTFLENIVILCFERRFSKPNSVIRVKSNILPPQNFWAGYATGDNQRFGEPFNIVKEAHDGPWGTIATVSFLSRFRSLPQLKTEKLKARADVFGYF